MHFISKLIRRSVVSAYFIPPVLVHSHSQTFAKLLLSHANVVHQQRYSQLTPGGGKIIKINEKFKFFDEIRTHVANLPSQFRNPKEIYCCITTLNMMSILLYINRKIRKHSQKVEIRIDLANILFSFLRIYQRRIN